MGNLFSDLELSPRPLTVADAAGLEASVLPTLWSPSLLLETDFNTATPLTGLTTAADVWVIRLIPPSAMPNFVFYPIAMRATLHNTDADAGMDDLFELAAMVAIEGVADQPLGIDTPWAFYSFDMDAVFSGVDASGDFKLQSAAPAFKGFPPKPTIATGGPTNRALGALMLVIKTFDATAAGNTFLHVDARWLAFPRPAVKSSGFYLPRLWFKPN